MEHSSSNLAPNQANGILKNAKIAVKLKYLSDHLKCH